MGRRNWLPLGSKTFRLQPAQVGAVVINPGTSEGKETWAKDIEIWTSMESPTDGFTKIATATLVNQRVDQPMTFPAVGRVCNKAVAMT